MKLKQLGEVSVQISDFKYITQLPVIYQPFRRQEEGGRGAVRAEVDRTLWPVKLTRSGEINVRRTDDERSCWISGIETTSNGNLILTDTGFSLSLKNVRLGPFLTLMSPKPSS